MKLGWPLGPTLDRKCSGTWKQVVARAKQILLDTEHINDWVDIPIAKENHQMFSFRLELCYCIKTTELRLHFIINVKKCFLNSGKQLYEKITSHYNNYAWRLARCSFNLEEFVKMKVPEPLTLTKLDSNMSYGPCFTAGLIDAVGDVSINHVPVARKIIFIARRCQAERQLKWQLSSVRAVLNSASKPPSK